MGITYNAGTNIITVTGYTQATPCTFLDIFNADVAGGWGKVTRQCTNQYCFTCGLAIGNSSIVTWFADVGQHLIFTSAAPREVVWTKANAHFRLGELISGKRTKNGCSLHTQRTTQTQLRGDNWSGGSAKIELYSSKFTSDSDSDSLIFYFATSIKVYNCLLARNVYFNLCSDVDYYNITLQGAIAGFRGSSGAFDKILVSDAGTSYGAVFAGAEGFTMKNLVARNNTYIFYAFSAFVSADGYGINWDVDTWNLYWDSSATKKLYRQYEFNLKVQDKDETAINGATVKIWDKDNNLIVDTTTNASGVIATQTLNYGYYNQAGGDTPTMQTPHTIEISKAGYQTYKNKFTMDEKISWHIRLLQSNPIQLLEGNPILQLCPESQEDDRTLFEVI